MARGGRKGLSHYYASKIMDNYLYNFYELESIALNSFTWENLPDDIPYRYIENRLVNNGMIGFYKNELGIICAGEVSILQLDRYDEPAEVMIRDNVDSVIKKKGDFAIIYNCIKGVSAIGEIDFFARKLSHIDDGIDENIDQQKFAQFVTCAESQVASVKAMFQAKAKGQPLIIADKDSMTDVSFNLLGNEIKYIANDMFDLQQKYRARYLNRLGVSAPVEKKERLLSGEVNNHNEVADILKSDYYKARLEGVEKVNKLFGCNIKVSYCEALQPVESKGSEENNVL